MFCAAGIRSVVYETMGGGEIIETMIRLCAESPENCTFPYFVGWRNGRLCDSLPDFRRTCSTNFFVPEKWANPPQVAGLDQSYLNAPIADIYDTIHRLGLLNQSQNTLEKTGHCQRYQNKLQELVSNPQLNFKDLPNGYYQPGSWVGESGTVSF